MLELIKSLLPQFLTRLTCNLEYNSSFAGIEETSLLNLFFPDKSTSSTASDTLSHRHKVETSTSYKKITLTNVSRAQSHNL